MKKQKETDIYPGMTRAGLSAAGIFCLIVALLIWITMLPSCSTGYHIGTNPEKKSNLTHWKEDSQAKKAAKAEKKAAKLKGEKF